MTILQLQRRIQEAGRIRIGQQVAATDRKGRQTTRPAKLDTFRITSADKARIEAIAELYGGTPAEWDAPAGKHWEVVTETDALPVIVPPSDMAFSQHMELWSAGGCQRRCDGVTESIGDQPCVCDPEAPECKIHTRLSVMLRDVPGLGVYRLDTQGYYAAVELQGAIEVVQMAAARGTMIPARLRLEQRQTKRPGQGTRRFAVPVIDLEISPAQLLGGGGGVAIGGNREAPAVGGGVASLPQGQPVDDDEPPALLTPVPPSVEERPVAPVADQAAQAGQRSGPRRAGAAQGIPRTGLAPRTAAQAAAGEAPERGEPEGMAPIDGEDLEALNVGQLKTRLKEAGLPVSGNKAELISRLEEHTSGSATAAEVEEPAPPLPDDDERQGVNPNGPPTDAQRKKLFAVLREHDISEAERKAVLAGSYKVESLNDLTSGQVAKLIDRLETPEGVERFKDAAEQWLAAAEVDQPEDPQADEPASEPEAEPAEQPEAAADDADGQEPDYQPADQPAAQPSLAERAAAHAGGTSTAVDRLQQRIRDAFATLAVHDAPVYEGGWKRLQDITDGRASQTDWAGVSEARLSALADDMERHVAELEDGGAADG